MFSALEREAVWVNMYAMQKLFVDGRAIMQKCNFEHCSGVYITLKIFF